MDLVLTEKKTGDKNTFECLHKYIIVAHDNNKIILKQLSLTHLVLVSLAYLLTLYNSSISFSFLVPKQLHDCIYT